jgi:hydroxymethylbilane synthase
LPSRDASAIRIGTRGSALALAQARTVAEAIEASGAGPAELVPITTSDHRRSGSDKSRFVKEIEDALLRGDVDLAVHSAKDVPGTLPDGLELVAAPPAEDPRDVLVGAGSIEQLAGGARVGTSSLRRRSQLLAIRRDLQPTELRGNVDTRLTKLREGGFDAIVLALAGLRRLGRDDEAGAPLAVEDLVPAPGQGILALEARVADERARAVARAVGDETAWRRLEAERAVVSRLGTSCHTPVGAHASQHQSGGALRIDAYAGLPDGSEWIRDRITGDGDARALGEALAERMLSAGAGELLRRAERDLVPG